MKVVICGTRDFNDAELLENVLEDLRLPITEIVSGQAKGADRLGELYADANDIPIAYFPANWLVFGKKAGPIRNEQMAEYCDLAVVFWDGTSKGTKNMIECLKRFEKPYYLRIYK